jgi:serine protease Do
MRGQSKNHLTKRRTLIAGTVGVAALLAAGLFTALKADTELKAETAPPPPKPADVRAGLEHATSLSDAFQSVAGELRPSVVSIRSTKRTQINVGNGGGNPFADLPPEFKRFFDEDTLERFEGSEQRAPRQRLQEGLGSGVVLSADGYIVTNNHVVDGADEVRVTLHDDRTFKATVVGTDERTDVAVLKIDAHDLVPAKLGNSDDLRVGQWVLAVGTPFGLDQTVTAGIVSARGRANMGITDYEDFVQTDAAINPGNSGGPLVNLHGEVVGINTAIASRSGGYNGIGFAIPSNMVGEIKEALIRDGHVERGRIGALIQNLTDELARSFDFDGEGVLVGDVQPDSPAEKAGLRSGDIVTKYDGRPMRDANHLRNTVAATKPGTKVPVELFRDGQPLTVQVEIARLGDEAEVVKVSGKSLDLGLTLRTLTPRVAEGLGYDAERTGVVVTEVTPGSVAARAGLVAKDVIVSIGGQDVEDVNTFEDAWENRDPNQGLRLQVYRDGLRRFVFLAE